MDIPLESDRASTAEWGKTPGQLLNRAFYVGETVDYAAPRIEQLLRNSFISGILGRQRNGEPSEYAKVFSDPEIGIGGRAAYVGGRLANDLVGDGTRIPYWFLNHPLAATGAAAQSASVAAGLAPDYGKIKAELQAQGKPHSRALADEIHAEEMGFAHGKGAKGIPSGLAKNFLPLLASVAMVQASGNHDLLNLLQGGRAAGYQAVLPSEEDPRQTTFAPGELALRYIAGRSGRLLPWEEFTQERPDVSEADYRRAVAHQFDKGPFDIGLVKATSRNLEGEPEATAMGFRVPLSAAATAGGAMVGGIAGANVLEGKIEQLLAQRNKEAVREGMLATRGGRKMLGALLGAVAGGVSGNLTSRAVNDLLIQPVLHPDLVEADRNWQAEQQARTLLVSQIQQQL